MVFEIDVIFRSNLTDGLFLLDVANNQWPHRIQRICVVICIRIISLLDPLILQWRWKLERGPDSGRRKEDLNWKADMSMKKNYRALLVYLSWYDHRVLRH